MTEEPAAPATWGLMSGLTTGGIGGSIAAVLFVLYKMCQKRRFKSSCCGGGMEIGMEISSGETPPPPPTTPSRTPVPSVERAVAPRRASVPAPTVNDSTK